MAACGGGSTATHTDARTVQVRLADFMITVPASVGAGAVSFDVQNAGPTPHQFTLEGPSGAVVGATRTLNPGTSAVLAMHLGPGTYTFLCALPGHASLGMKGSFTVTGG